MLHSLLEDFVGIPALLKKAETYCMEFAIEFLRQKSGNFEKVDSHYDADGLVTTYKCARDGRIYTVKVTPSKP